MEGDSATSEKKKVEKLKNAKSKKQSKPISKSSTYRNFNKTHKEDE